MDTQSLFLTITVVIGFSAILSWFSYQQQQSSWKGTVVDKIYEKELIDDDGGRDEQFKLVCKTATGKKVTIGVFKDVYEDLSIGDSVEKKKGSYMPEKIS